MYIANEKLHPLVKTLYDFGFSNAQIRKMIIRLKKISDRLDRVEESYIYYHAQMVKKGYSEYQIKELACRYPRAMFHKFCKGKLKSEFEEYANSLPRDGVSVEENNEFDFDGIRKILLDLGLEEKRVDYIFSINSEIIFMSKDMLKSNIKFYHNCGLTDADIVKIESKHAMFLERGEDYYKDVLGKLLSIGLTLSDFGKLQKCTVRERRLVDANELDRIINWSIKKDLDLYKFFKGITKTFTIAHIPEEALDKGFQNLLDLGFNEDEAAIIISNAPSTLTMSYANLSNKFQVPIKYGCNLEETKKIVVESKRYFTLSEDNLDSKFKIYRKWGLMQFIVKKPRNIIQSADLTDARAEYLLKYYPSLSEESYYWMVFTSEDIFKKRFKGNNKYVLSLKNKFGGEKNA